VEALLWAAARQVLLAAAAPSAFRLDHLQELTPVTYLFRQGWRPQELVERLQ
jgi:hypothetical protein